MADSARRARAVITEIPAHTRRRIAQRGGHDLLWRTHCAVVTVDDPTLTDIVASAARAGAAARRTARPDLRATRVPVVIERLGASETERFAATHPRHAAGAATVVVAARSRRGLLTALRAIRTGAELVDEAMAPSTAVPAATVVLTDAARRTLAAHHPELRRTRAAVVVSVPRAASLLTHVHLAASDGLSREARPDVIGVTLSRDERRALTGQHRELAQHDDLVLFAGAQLQQPLEAARLMRALTRFRAAVEDVQVAQFGPPRPPAMLRRVVAQRAHLAATQRLLRAGEVGLAAGSRAANPAHLAQTWKSQKRVLAYRDNGQIVYPAFQFDAGGKPRPQIARVLALTPEPIRGGLSTAVWLVTPNRRLGNRAPLDLLDTDMPAVERAVAARWTDHLRSVRSQATRNANRRGLA